MWQMLCPLLIAVSTLAAEPSTGPTSSAEAQIIYSQAKESYQAARYSDAIVPLERLIERYPAYPDAATYRELRAWLGRSYLETGKTQKATRQLRAYLEGSAKRKLENEAKLWLGEAYLRLKNFHRAYLLSTEKNSLTAQNLVLRARALLGLRHDVDAQKAVEEAAHSTDASQAGTVSALALEIKTRSCAKLPSPGPHSEDQVKDQMIRRGICLAEALPMYRATLEKGDEQASDRAQQLIVDAIESYEKACADVPPPLRKRGAKKLTAKELARYRSELREMVEAECRNQFSFSHGLVKDWISSSTPADEADPRLIRIQSELGRRAGDNPS